MRPDAFGMTRDVHRVVQMKLLLSMLLEMSAPFRRWIMPDKTTARLFKVLAVMAITCLSVIGLVELPGVLYPFMWRCTGLRVPFASAYYRVNVSNRTGQEMAFTAFLINDRRFYPSSGWRERTEARTGWRSSRDVVIPDGGSAIIELASPSDPRLGILMVVGRTAVMSDSPPLRQGMGMKFLTWPWRDGIHVWRDKGEWSLLSCAFDYDDVLWMKGDSGDAEGPIVPVLRRLLTPPPINN